MADSLFLLGGAGVEEGGVEEEGGAREEGGGRCVAGVVTLLPCGG